MPSKAGPASELPDFASGSELAEAAYRFALEAHHGERNHGDTQIDHPLAVARLVAEAGLDEEAVAAALLHDVIEDTNTELSEVEARFGPEVAHLVATMTEDAAIEPYVARKAEHRSRVAREGGRRAASIYAADKLAKVRALNRDEDRAELPAPRLEHYRETLRALEQRYPDLPFLRELAHELALLA